LAIAPLGLAGCSGDATVEQMMDTMQRVTKLETRADQTTAEVNALKAAQAPRPAAAQPIPPVPVAPPATPPASAPAAAPAAPAAPASGAPVPVTPPAPPAAAAAPAPTNELKFAVHLASYKHEAEAAKGWSQLQARYPALKPMEARLSRVDLGPKGIYFRLKAGPLADQKAAQTLCRQLKGAGVGYCNPEGFDGKPLGS
jgi:TolA-binding protein